MIRRPRLVGLASIALVSFLAPALADVPPAMDRVPADAAIVVSVKDIGKLKAGVDSLAKALNVPAAEMQNLMRMGDILKMQGADANGSAALAVMSIDGDEPEVIGIVPVKDYAAFVKNFGGTGNGVEELKLEDKPAFAKSIEGGFAAVGPNKTLIEKFAGKAGNGKSHEALMGATGKAIADSCDIVVVANIGKFGDHLKEGVQGVKDQMGMMMAMAGGGGDLSGLDAFVNSFVRDASAGILGFKVSEAGLTVDAGAQFKDSSEYAGYFNAKGKAADLVGTLPNQPYLFAIMLDTSSPSIRKLLKDLQAFGAKMSGEKDDAGNGILPNNFAEKADGIAFQLGNSPAPIGGLFLNTLAFIKTSQPAELAKTVKEEITAKNGKTIGGMTYTTTYQEGVQAGSTTADSWSMKMQPDPEDPKASQINQVNTMLFGPGGLQGYTAKTDGGLVVTYAKNSELLNQALSASKGTNLGVDPDVKKIGSSLPSDRVFEGYIGVQSLLETAMGLLGPMGVAPNVPIPEGIPPVGAGATATGGGLRFTVVIPTKVMTSIKSIVDAMDQGGGKDEKDDKGAGQPKF